jgi:hypothetical protein
VVPVIVNYNQLVARYPDGGGAAAAAGEEFGEAVAFVPIGALIVDFVLTIAISSAAGASAIITYVPDLAAGRVPLALLLVCGVAAGTWFGHIGRTVFAVMTVAFIAVAAVVLAFGLFAPPNQTGTISDHAGHAPPVPVFAAVPLVTALLLLSAASLSFQAGPGLLKALAWHRCRAWPDRRHRGRGQIAPHTANPTACSPGPTALRRRVTHADETPISVTAVTHGLSVRRAGTNLSAVGEKARQSAPATEGSRALMHRFE